MLPQPLLRTARSTVFATVCVTLAAVGHSLSSRDVVPAWAVLTGFAAVLGVSLTLAGHERSLATLLGGLLGGQFALHTLFGAATQPMIHHASDAHPAARGSGVSMTLAHVAAAVLAALWLRRGERAAWSLARRLAERPVPLPRLLVVEPVAPVVRIRVVAADAVAAIGEVLRHQVFRRGPPDRSRALAWG
ncbi:MFS transporter [Actinomadura sp. NEAU-AAG7]|uniref:MFS transporter n=1 Tax=Actinomadura sp. NEAU-AAG7 TaxID=2839640 RepID=UPI001BE46B22|nr:MFS transporter [Actinomadura sp. NEAU-AAG7]MBT2207406.1 MFS transporter [Actinomadura sp. NEAU-AAG7]